MNEKEKPEIAEIDESEDKEIQEKLNQAKIQYPQWTPNKIGQTMTGYVKEVLTFRDLNGKDKHGILFNFQTKNEKYPMVSKWLNTVLVSNFKRLSVEQNFSDFESMTRSLKTCEGRLFAIRFEGEEKPTQKGFKPYQNYTVVEV